MELGPAAGFHTKHQRFISKDRELLKLLEGAVGKGGDAGSSLLILRMVTHITDESTWQRFLNMLCEWLLVLLCVSDSPSWLPVPCLLSCLFPHMANHIPHNMNSSIHLPQQRLMRYSSFDSISPDAHPKCLYR